MGTSDNHSWSAVSVTPASAIEIEKTFNSFNREHEGPITGHSLGGTLIDMKPIYIIVSLFAVLCSCCSKTKHSGNDISSSKEIVSFENDTIIQQESHIRQIIEKYCHYKYDIFGNRKDSIVCFNVGVDIVANDTLLDIESLDFLYFWGLVLDDGTYYDVHPATLSTQIDMLAVNIYPFDSTLVDFSKTYWGVDNIDLEEAEAYTKKLYESLGNFDPICLTFKLSADTLSFVRRKY